MVVHQQYLSRETAMLARRCDLDADGLARARETVVRLASRLAPADPDAVHEVLAALGLDLGADGAWGPVRATG